MVPIHRRYLETRRESEARPAFWRGLRGRSPLLCLSFSECGDSKDGGLLEAPRNLNQNPQDREVLDSGPLVQLVHEFAET